MDIAAAKMEMDYDYLILTHHTPNFPRPKN
jgi:hypothetical protein